MQKNKKIPKLKIRQSAGCDSSRISTMSQSSVAKSSVLHQSTAVTKLNYHPFAQCTQLPIELLTSYFPYYIVTSLCSFPTPYTIPEYLYNLVHLLLLQYIKILKTIHFSFIQHSLGDYPIILNYPKNKTTLQYHLWDCFCLPFPSIILSYLLFLWLTSLSIFGNDTLFIFDSLLLNPYHMTFQGQNYNKHPEI